MNKTLDTSRNLSEQDGGGFLEVATLEETPDGKLVLKVSAGYGPESHNDDAKYQLASRPAKTLDEYESDGWLDPCNDQSEDLTKILGVEVTQHRRMEAS